MQFHGAHPENLLKNDDYGLTVDMLPEELGGTLPHGDILAKVCGLFVNTLSVCMCLCGRPTCIFCILVAL